MSKCEKCEASAENPPLWCFTKGCTIQAAIVRAALEQRAVTPPVTMKLRTAPSMVSCADCGYAIRFEPTADWKAGIAIGACSGPSCQNYRKPFKFPLPIVEVEFIEQEQP